MTLYINTSDNTKTTIGLDDYLVTEPSGEKKSQFVLELLERMLKEKGREFRDITEIQVEIGPGSYTGLKVGVTIANTLAWALSIPVNGQKMVEPKYEQ
jgi:tRNA A37 threonylcarbamoyladenosine modification protein TsaB